MKEISIMEKNMALVNIFTNMVGDMKANIAMEISMVKESFILTLITNHTKDPGKMDYQMAKDMYLMKAECKNLLLSLKME